MGTDPEPDPKPGDRWTEIRLASRGALSGWRRSDRARGRTLRVRHLRDAWRWEVLDRYGRVLATDTAPTAADAMSQADRS